MSGSSIRRGPLNSTQPGFWRHSDFACMSALLRAYGDFVRDHEAIIAALDDMARSLLLLIPGRFGRSELTSESLHVLLNLITFHHNLILGRPCAFSALLSVPSTPKTQALQNMLAIVQNIEILLEMLAERSMTTQNRWRFILLMESLKAAIRLSLVQENKGAMVMQATPDEAVCIIEGSTKVDRSESSSRFSDIIDMYRRHGRSAVRPHGVFCSHSSHIGKVTPYQLASEILFIIRPVVYVAGVLKYSLRSWKPFFAALLTDIASRSLIGKMNDVTPRQRQEVHRRTFLWLFYLLRSPCFEKYTMYPLIKSLSLCENIPLIGIIFGNCLELVKSLQSHYFYTSAS